jgi:hypothetical protein
MIVLTVTLSLILLVLTLRFGMKGLARLNQLHLRGGWLAVLALLAQVMSMIVQQQRLPLLLITSALLAGFCWLNRRQAGIILAGFGIALNMIVIAANGGAMPVNPAAFSEVNGRYIETGSELSFSKSVVLDDHTAALAWLGDRLLLPGPLAKLAAWSIGDVFLVLGVGLLLWRTMKGTEGHVGHNVEGHAPLS